MTTYNYNYRLERVSRPTPQSGFTGPTSQPATVGDDPTALGYASVAIAKWDVIPGTQFHDELNVGVVAFHASGINRVEFSVDGGPSWPITTMTPNPHTFNPSGVGVFYDVTNTGVYVSGVVEYWATLKAADFGDKYIEARAVVYPHVGIPAVLEPLHLWSNPTGGVSGIVMHVSKSGNDSAPGDGSVTHPYLTVKKAMQSFPDLTSMNNSIIMLGSGLYSEQDDSTTRNNGQTGFITIQPEDGLSFGQAIISNSVGWLDGYHHKMIHWKNLYVRASGVGFEYIYGASGTSYWFEHCYMEGPGEESHGNWFSGAPSNLAYVYLTGCTFGDSQDGIVGGGQIERNCLIHNIQGDVHRGESLVINTQSDFPHSLYQGTNLVVDGSDPTLVTPDGYTPKDSNLEINNNNTLSIAGGAGFTTSLSTTLTAAITASDQLTISVAATTGYAAPFKIYIDSEILEVTSIAAGTWTVTRGVDGSIATTHSNGATVAIAYSIIEIVSGKWRLNHAPASAGTTGGQWILYTGAHSDFWQCLNSNPISFDNVIMYGCSGIVTTAGGFSTGATNFDDSGQGPHKNWAIINTSIQVDPAGAGWGCSVNLTNYIMENCNFGNGRCAFDAIQAVPVYSGVVIKNCLPSLFEGEDQDGITRL